MQPLQRIGSPEDVAEAALLPRERPRRADHRGRAPGRRRHHRRLRPALDAGASCCAEGELDERRHRHPGRDRRRRHRRARPRRRRRDRRRRRSARSAPDLDGRASSTRRVRRRARLHRHPHALRRAGVLGSGAAAVVVPRRHHRRGGQLRLHDRADAARAPRDDRAHARERRGHGPGHADGRHRVGLRDVPRVPRRGPPPRDAISTSPRTSATRRCGCT